MAKVKNVIELQDILADAESRMRGAATTSEACSAALDAAELCIQMKNLLSDDNGRKELDQKCRKYLDRAECFKSSNQKKSAAIDRNIKEQGAHMNTPQNSSKSSASVSTRAIPKREQIILWQGSKLHGSSFPPWEKAPSTEEFEGQDGQIQFIDPSPFKLSSLQNAVFDGWRRPKEIANLQNHNTPVDRSTNIEPTMTSNKKIDLVQDMTSDCSVVASLCALVARAEQGHIKLLSSIMFPYDDEAQRPSISSNGKYIFKLNFNGCCRRVIIDDRLPASTSSRILYVVDRSNLGLLWPALIEKAYLKIRGGYDFPGSNSGTDLWALTGWIPEQVFLQSDDVVPERVWPRILKAFGYGDVLITMGTGKLSSREEEDIGLAGEHDYAIIDLKEDENGRRLFLVKNPWSQGCTWKQPIDQRMNEKGLVPSEHLTPGTFWMDINNVFQHFESIYLNWNPDLFPNRQDVHFEWDLNEGRSAEGSFDRNPQYLVRSMHGGTMWILLSRHFRDNSGEHTNRPKPDTGFMSIYTFDNDGNRVLLTEDPLLRSPYVDATNALLRLELPAKSSYTIVVSEQELPPARYVFSLSIFSLKLLEVAKAPEKYSNLVTRQSSWTVSTSGGNANSSKYHTNPQFSLVLSARSDVVLLITAESEEFHVHVKLVWASGKRAKNITNRDIVGDSGEYRKGSAHVTISDVQSGTYTVICSTFEPGQRGKFSLQVRTMTECSLRTIPLEEAGRLVTKVPRATMIPGTNRLLVPLKVSRISRIRTLAHLPSMLKAQSSSPLRIALEHGQGPHKHVLAISCGGKFVDTSVQLELQDVDVVPKMCHDVGVWLVLERMEGSFHNMSEVVDIELLSDNPIQVGLWGQEVDRPLERHR